MSLDVELYLDIDSKVEEPYQVVLFESNITHNLTEMASAAEIYYPLWRPEEKGFIFAKDIIDVVEAGLVLMRSDPERFKKYDAPNGWGLYENFVPWVEEYLNACKEHPNARIRVDR